jgi:hypothetical protein
MTTTTMATTTRAPVPGRRLLAAVGIWTGVATAAGVATFLAARAIAPRWATAANLGTVIAAEVSTALVVVLLVVSNQPLGWRIPRRQDLAWGWRPPPPPGRGSRRSTWRCGRRSARSTAWSIGWPSSVPTAAGWPWSGRSWPWCRWPARW